MLHLTKHALDKYFLIKVFLVMLEILNISEGVGVRTKFRIYRKYG